MEDKVPPQVKYWLSSSRNDCFFIVGPPSGPVERIGSFKIILMGHSEPMCKLLEESEIAEKGDISLPDIEPKTFKDFLKCVYGGGDVVIRHLDFEDCAKLLYIAEKYMVTQVKQDVLDGMVELFPLSLDDAFVALKNIVCFVDERLDNAITDVIRNGTDKIFADNKFLEINSEALLLIVQQETINVNEIEVFKSVLKWGKKISGSQDGGVVRQYISKHLQHIRFRVFSLEEFCLEIIPTGVLTAEEACQICTSIAGNKPHNLVDFSDEKIVRTQKLPKALTLPLVLSYIIQNISSIQNDTNQFSCPSNLGDFSWRILMGRGDGHLSLFLKCKPKFNDDHETSWECKAFFQLILINQCGKGDFKRSLQHQFTNAEDDWGYSHFMDWGHLVSPSNGFVKNDNIVVMALVSLE